MSKPVEDQREALYAAGGFKGPRAAAKKRQREKQRAEAALFAPGSHGCHEALHLASVMADIVDKWLAQHPAVRQDPRWRRLADQAVDNLADLYQAIGQAHMIVPGPEDVSRET